MLEVVVSALIDQLKWSRGLAVTLAALGSFVLGIPSGLSSGFLGHMDTFAGNYLLLVGGFCLAIFVGWVWGVREAITEIRKPDVAFFLGTLWSYLIRYLAPFAIGMVLLWKLSQLFKPGS